MYNKLQGNRGDLNGIVLNYFQCSHFSFLVDINQIFSDDKDQICFDKKFEEITQNRMEYYKEREKAIFGYEDKDENFPNLQSKVTKQKSRKDDKGVKNFELKFNFSDNESDDEDDILSENNRELKVYF